MVELAVIGNFVPLVSAKPHMDVMYHRVSISQRTFDWLQEYCKLPASSYDTDFISHLLQVRDVRMSINAVISPFLEEDNHRHPDRYFGTDISKIKMIMTLVIICSVVKDLHIRFYEMDRIIHMFEYYLHDTERYTTMLKTLMDSIHPIERIVDVFYHLNNSYDLQRYERWFQLRF